MMKYKTIQVVNQIYGLELFYNLNIPKSGTYLVSPKLADILKNNPSTPSRPLIHKRSSLK